MEPLTVLKVGQSGRIVFITPRTKKILNRLASYGVVPGSELTLRQRYPSYIIHVDQTEVAIETDIAKEIFIRPNRD